MLLTSLAVVSNMNDVVVLRVTSSEACTAPGGLSPSNSAALQCVSATSAGLCEPGVACAADAKAEPSQLLKTEFGEFTVDNRCWARIGFSLTQVSWQLSSSPSCEHHHIVLVCQGSLAGWFSTYRPMMPDGC